MRVLSFLLLFVSALCNAQVTKTITGTVKHDPGQKKTTFETPNGKIIVCLPDDMAAGDQISGSVLPEPTGKNKKEVQKNLSTLQQFSLQWGKYNLKVPSGREQFILQYSPPSIEISEKGITASFIVLKNAKGVDVSTVQWTNLPVPVVSSALTDPNGILDRNVYSTGDQLLWYNPANSFSPTDKFALTDNKNQVVEVKTLSQSPRQAIIGIPENISTGYYTLSCQSTDGKVMEKKDIAVYDLQLTSPNMNLQSGQESKVQAMIILPDDGWIERPLPFPFHIDIENVNPNNVTMRGGNIQRVTLPLNNKWGERNAWQFTRSITGIRPGSFSVSATLHNDFNVSNDPFTPQLNVLKTPEDFNRWTDALKKDLQQYAALQNSTPSGQAIKDNVQRTLDNLPGCMDASRLNECKALTNGLLRPLNIPRGAAVTWTSGYEAFKAAAKTITNHITGDETELIDFDIINNGLKFISQAGQQMNDEALKNDAAELIARVDNTKGVVGSDHAWGKVTDLPDLSNKINAMTANVDAKIGPDPYRFYKYTMEDLLVSSYSFGNVGIIYDTKPGEKLFKEGDPPVDNVKKLEDSLKKRKDELEQKKRERDITIDDEIKKAEKAKRDCDKELEEAKEKAAAAGEAFDKAKQKKDNIERNIGPGKTFPDKDAAKKNFGDYEKEYNDAKDAKDAANINLAGLKKKCPELTKALNDLKNRKTVALPDEIKKGEEEVKQLEDELEREKTKAEAERKRVEDERKKAEEEQRQKTQAEKDAEDAKYKTKAENSYLLQNVYSLGLISSKIWETPGLMDWLPDILEKPVGDAAEDLVKTPIPLDAITAIAGLYSVVGAKLDPCTAEGSITTIGRLKGMKNTKTDKVYTDTEAMDKTDKMCELLNKLKAIAAAAKKKK